MLSQENHHICYASRTLNQHEINYSTVEKELLAVAWAVTYFRPYLFGRKFVIQTDHQPLQWLVSIKEPNSKLVRWRLKLEEYDYEIVYKRGINNGNADALSRIEPQINLIHYPQQNLISESNAPINVYRNQIIIQKSNSPSIKIIRKTIFKNRRTFITSYSINENDIFIPDSSFYEVFKETVLKYFSHNSLLKIAKCNTF